MTTQPAPFGSLLVPALAAFLTCFAFGIALCALMGITMSIAVPVGAAISAVGAISAAFASGRTRQDVKRKDRVASSGRRRA